MRSVLVLNSLCFAWQVWLHQGVALRWGRSYALYSQGPCSNVANEGLFSCVGDANLLQSDAVGAEYLAFDSMRRTCGVTNQDCVEQTRTQSLGTTCYCKPSKALLCRVVTHPCFWDGTRSGLSCSRFGRGSIRIETWATAWLKPRNVSCRAVLRRNSLLCLAWKASHCCRRCVLVLCASHISSHNSSRRHVFITPFHHNINTPLQKLTMYEHLHYGMYEHQTILRQAFEKLPISWVDQHVFVDWDGDDDLDVIKVNVKGRTCGKTTRKPCENGRFSSD